MLESESDSEQLIKDYLDQGQDYYDQGNYSEAILEWQKALDLKPNDTDIIKKIQEAMAEIKK